MGEKKLREYLSFEELKRDVVDWSYDTFVRRVKNDEFPAFKENGQWLIPSKDMELWFKKRRANR